LGHLRTAVEIGQALGLAKIYLTPSASPPHKTGEPVTPFHQRLTMTRLAAENSPLLEATDLEGRRNGPSYSIETLRQLHRITKGDFELYFLMGSDAFLEIRTWREYPSLFEYANFVIIKRSGIQPGMLETLILSLEFWVEKARERDVYVTASGKKLILMASTIMDISSTRIRHLVAGGKSIQFLLPESVRDYIIKNGLYRNNGCPR
jgi:nicotinate-nucleotide adenylyltransferase